MDSEHRKIELQSPADLTYLMSRIRTLARSKLDLHLPPVSDTSGEPDELRKQVEERVNAFVSQVLAGLRHNISINGLDVVRREGQEGDAMDGIEGVHEVEDGVAEVEEFEPFDEKLRSRLASTTQKRDALVSKISQHRRNTPATAAQQFEAQFSAEMASLGQATLEAESMAGVVREEDVASVDGIARAEEVSRNWERAVEGLMRLNKGLPETRARLERCGDVVGYLEAGRK